MTTLHYRADAGTPALLLIKEYFDRCTATMQAMADFVETRYGVSDARVYRYGNGVVAGVASPLGMSASDFGERLGAHWKRKEHIFSPYVKGNKKLYQEWKAIPRLHSIEDLKGELTGVTSFIDWMDGMQLCGMGLAYKSDETLAVITLPLCVCTNKAFKPREGMIRVVDAIEADRLWKSCAPPDRHPEPTP